MESPDNQTPPPAASRRPNLLNPGIQDQPDKASAPSMLASLERDGKFQGPATSARRGFGRGYRAPLFGLLLVVGGAGALFFYRSSGETDLSAANAGRAAAPQGAAPASPGLVDAARAGAPAIAAGSAPSPAQIEVAGALAKSVQPAAAVAPSEVASAPSGVQNPLDKLAASAGDATAAAVSPLRVTPGKKAHAAGVLRPPAKGVASPNTVAHAGRLQSGARKARMGDEDADTELVAAMIARLDRRGANPVPSASARQRLTADAGLAEKLRQCGTKSDLLDARRCRSNACETHWGKVDACPASRAPRPLLGERIDHGSPG